MPDDAPGEFDRLLAEAVEAHLAIDDAIARSDAAWRSLELAGYRIGHEHKVTAALFRAEVDQQRTARETEESR